MQALTLVLNPNARKPRLRPPSLRRLRKSLGPASNVHVTRDLDELDELMRAWTGKSEETLCFYGGDGSIARGLTSLIRHRGEEAPLPPVLAVRAGTFNMLCNVLGMRERVDRTLVRWYRGELGGVKAVPLLRVEVAGRLPQYGFVFAWGVGNRVLREYYSRRPVPHVFDAVAVLARTVVLGALPGASERSLFRAEDLRLELDGAAAPSLPLHALTVGTISRLSLGLRPFPPEPIRAGGFHVSGNGMPLGHVVWHAPTLLFGLGDQRRLAPERRLVAGAGVRELRCVLSEGFTMDGETFDLPGDLPAHTPVRITPGPIVRFWTKPNSTLE